MAARTLELEVVGMNHRMTPATMGKLHRDAPVTVRLEREPGNAWDENAVKVMVTEKPWAKPNGDFHAGYISRAVAKVIAPRIDSGSWPYAEAFLTEVDANTGRGTLLLRRKGPVTKPRAKGKSKEIG